MSRSHHRSPPRLPRALVVVALAVTMAAGVEAGACPPVNKRGFRPGAVVAYTVAPAPDGTPFPDGWVPCVRRAFHAWTRANARTGLGVRFVWGAGGIEVHLDKPGGLLLPPGKGGAWADPVRSADGFLERAHIWLSSSPALVDTCEGVTKLTLHELGHLHGLADRDTDQGRSVMNRAVSRNDRGHRIPLWPSRCDAERARAASLDEPPSP